MTGIMPWTVMGVNLVALLATLIGQPAPATVGPLEIALGIVAGLAVVLSVIGWSRADEGSPSTRFGMVVVCLFVLPVLGSLVVAAVRGIDWTPALRSAAPYLAFVGFGFAARRVPVDRQARSITLTLMIVGLLHAVYLLALFVGTTSLTARAPVIRLARITLLDPRTTLPLAMVAAVLPWATLIETRRWLGRVALVMTSGVATVAVVATQTRSMILGLGLGVVTTTVLAGSWRRLASGSTVGGAVRRAGFRVALLGLAAVLTFAVVPPLRELALSVALRTRLEGDTGRLNDEWRPVVASLADGGTASALFGAGAGQSFVTGSGKERTYIHNVILYGLYYSGIPGGAMWLLAYAALGAGLVKRGWREGVPALLGLAGVVLALFVYGQFFAVHKLLSYNLILMLGVQGLTAASRRRVP